MPKLSFADQVKNWANKTEQRLELVFQESIQILGEEMNKPRANGGNMPIDTGFLVNSTAAAINADITGKTKSTGSSSVSWDNTAFVLVVNSAKLGDSVSVGYTAVYAARMEYGFTGTDSLGRSYNQQGYGFMRLAAQKWPQIVNEAIRRADQRIEANANE